MEGGAGRLASLAGQVEPHLYQPVESPKPGAGSRVTQVAMSQLSLPSPLKLLNWDLLAGRCKKEFSEDPLQSIPVSQACPETSLMGGWGRRGAAVLGLHSRRVVVSKGDSPG